MGRKGKKHTPSAANAVNLQHSTLLQLIQLGGYSLKAKALTMRGMSPTVQLWSLWSVFVLLSGKLLHPVPKPSTWIMKIFNCVPSKTKTCVSSWMWRLCSWARFLQCFRRQSASFGTTSPYCRTVSLRPNYAAATQRTTSHVLGFYLFIFLLTLGIL